MKKLLLAAVILLLLVVALPTKLTKASVVSPYIAIVPQTTMNPTLTLGKNYTVSIYTDYSGSDITGYQFTLFYNPSVLRGVAVTNGDIITKERHSSAQFMPGTFNNTQGKLKETGGFFFWSSEPAPTTFGPGTLANVTFTVVGIGTSDIILGYKIGEETKLMGYTENGMGEPYNIIDAHRDLTQIGNGYFHNIRGDLDGDRYVGPIDLSYFAASYGKRKGQSGYNLLADLDGDGYVGPIDLSLFAAAYGKRY